MLDWYKLMNLVNNNNPESMNETNLGIPLEKSDYKQMASGKRKTTNGWHIAIRVGISGAAYNDTSSQHACSIKVQKTGSFNMKLAIPTVSYETLPTTDIAVKDMESFCAKADKDIRDAVRSFVYDNQMAIIAYWYTPSNENEPVAKALEEYMHNQLVQKEYTKNKVTKPKSPDELEADKEALNNYVRQKLDNSSIQLHYGSTKRK